MSDALISNQIIQSEGLRSPSFWDFFGFSKNVVASLNDFFSYGTLHLNLQWINFILTIFFGIALLALFSFLYKIFSYSKPVKLKDKLELIPTILNENQSEYFEKYCKREGNGTYACSYVLHQKYRLFTKLGLQGAFLAGLLKIFVIIFIFIIQAGYLKAFEGRVGTNYSIFIDSAVSGGGNLASATYDMDASFGEAIASSRTSSNSYNEAAGVTALTDEPHISFTVNGGLASLGVLTNQSTAYNTATFNVSYNGLSGYDVVLFGTPPTNGAGDVIDPIGGTSDFPTTDTEQFGINLRGNTNPAVVGSDPTGGLGAVIGQYGIVNKYAFNIGDIVATSTAASSRTDYTATIITNISNITPAGSYIGTLEFSLVPKF